MKTLYYDPEQAAQCKHQHVYVLVKIDEKYLLPTKYKWSFK